MLERYHGDGVSRSRLRFIPLYGLPRNNAVLTAIIEQHVAPGTRIMTDKWLGYHGPITLEQLGYTHFSVNHNENFIAPENPEVHTQTIEGAWKHLRAAIPPCGLRGAPQQYAQYLAAHVYRNRMEHDPEFRGACKLKTFLRHGGMWHAAGMPLGY